MSKVCTLLFLRKNDEILLAMKKRGFGSDRYNGVGGKVEVGETLEQALVRECQEEIGVTPKNYWKIAEHDFLQTEGAEPWRMYVHAYFCDTWEGEPIETDEMAPEWFLLANIPYDSMWEDDRHWLPLALQNHKIYGQFTFDKNDEMTSHNIALVDTLPGVIPSAPLTIEAKA